MTTLVQGIVQQYWENWSGQESQGAGGWNNTTYFVQNHTQKAVVRIYNTHQDIEKIKFEHHVLLLLQQQKYSFRVPKPMVSLNGDTIVQVGDGTGRYACLFQYIKVESSQVDTPLTPKKLGEAAGELSVALSQLEYTEAPVYRPYYELQQAYSLCQDEELSRLCNDPPIDLRDVQDGLRLLYETYLLLVSQLGTLRELPHQLVHGDLNKSNLLSEQGEVTAWLDFEFCTRDIRVMEASVILSDLLGGEYEVVNVEQFCIGFRQYVQLTQDEIIVIPLLMKLRKVDVFLHFTSRYLENIDPPSVLSEQVQLLAQDVEKLRRSQAWLGKELEKLLG